MINRETRKKQASQADILSKNAKKDLLKARLEYKQKVEQSNRNLYTRTLEIDLEDQRRDKIKEHNKDRFFRQQTMQEMELQYRE